MANQAEDFQAENLEDAQQAENTRLQERLLAIIGRLDKEADDRVGKRSVVEQRWLLDLAQYHGNYAPGLAKKLKEARKSTLYINSTRPKTNSMASRLSDMLFPTDERNWGIQPTPVPELTVRAEQEAQAAAQAEVALAENPDDRGQQVDAQEANDAMNATLATMEEAKKRGRAMEEEIDDHLREAQYGAQCRVVIEDACKIGTGVMKGPVIGDRSRSSWKEQGVDDGNGTAAKTFALTDVDDPRPVFWRVNPWDWFPDMDATDIEDSEGNFERHLMNKKQLRRLARQPDFDKEAIRRLLVMGANEPIPTYIADLRQITGAYHDSVSDRYHVWEYHGPLMLDEMRDVASLMEDDEMLGELEDLEVDPLDELEAVAWFCQGELLKFGLHYLDSGESIYSVFCLEKDDAGIFGFGVPYIMRDPQKAMASAWRTLMDNAGLSSGPQIVINKGVIYPENDNWTLEPRKVWLRNKNAPKGEKPFETFDIPSHMEELSALIELCKKNIDEETNLPLLAQGEQGAHITKTAQGMSLLMNSVNVIFRRIVKNWDDDQTTRNIRRMYDFLMQFSEKEYIKGDFEIDARGSSVLLVREMQSQNLLLFLSNFAGHAVLGKYLKQEGLPALRALAKTMMIPADEVVKTDDEVSQDEAKAASQPEPPDPEVLKYESILNKAQIEMDGRKELALIERDTVMMRLAEESNVSLEQLMATLDAARETREAKQQSDREGLQSKERIFAAEAAVTAKEGPGGGGYL